MCLQNLIVILNSSCPIIGCFWKSIKDLYFQDSIRNSKITSFVALGPVSTVHRARSCQQTSTKKEQENLSIQQNDFAWQANDIHTCMSPSCRSGSKTYRWVAKLGQSLRIFPELQLNGTQPFCTLHWLRAPLRQ